MSGTVGLTYEPSLVPVNYPADATKPRLPVLKMKIAITGGSGFVGSHTARHLSSLGHYPVIVTRKQFQDVPALRGAFTECEAVVHCAGINREKGENTYDRVHVEGTRNVVRAAKEAGVKKVILTSYLRARPGTGFSYFESKWQAEELVRSSGLDYTVFKFGMIFGDGDQMLHNLVASLTKLTLFATVGLKEKSVNPVAVNDVVRLIKQATVEGQFPNMTVSVVGPEEMTLSEVVRRVARVIRRKVLIFPLPIFLHYFLAWLGEKVMAVPIVTVAQVRMLSEGISEPLKHAPVVSPDHAPTIRLDEATIRRSLEK